jgi:hypothetical protein
LGEQKTAGTPDASGEKVRSLASLTDRLAQAESCGRHSLASAPSQEQLLYCENGGATALTGFSVAETDADLPKIFDLLKGDRPPTQKCYRKISKSTM